MPRHIRDTARKGTGRRIGPRRGFTLVELIVIIVVAGLLGVLLVNLLGTQMLRSASPVVTAKESAQAETELEVVLAYYTSQVNTNLSSALDNVKTHFAGNSTIAFPSDDANWQGTGTRVLTVTVTAGGSQLSALLTQSRTNASDTATNY